MSSLSDPHTMQLALAAGISLFAIIGLKYIFGGSSKKGLQKLLAQRATLQSVEVGPAGKNEGPVHRKPANKDKLLEYFDPKITTLVELFDSVVEVYGNRPFLGKRRKDQGQVGPYEFITYAEVKQQRDDLGSGISLLGQKPGEPVGIYSQNRPEWIVGDLASSAFGWPSVALYDTLGADSVEYIINHAEIKVVITGGEKQFKTILAAKKNCKGLKTVITLDPVSQDDQNQAKALGLDIYTYADILKKGHDSPQPFHQVKPEDIYTIMYTSGTTGNPKGVVLTHRNGIAEVAGVRAHEEKLFSAQEVHISYLPLAHSFERTVTYVVISYGAQIGYFQGVITELFNDIAELKPTFLIGAPRVWNRLRDKILLSLSASAIRKKLFEWGYASKKAALERGETSPFWDKILFSKVQQRLGGRVKWLLSGSAPLDPKLGEFLKICFSFPIIEGYGLTETFAGAFITPLNETQLGHVGTVLGCSEVKLQDIPEMDYYANRNPPKGEILIRGANIFREYYKDKKQTEEVLQADGWFHTGDVGRWNPNGTLSIIDRKKNIFKLEQGEYVAVETLEGVYVGSKYVAQIWVYGSSYQRFLIAFVVPDFEVLTPWANQQGIKGSNAELCQNPIIKKEILKDLTEVGKGSKLQGFEFIKAITLLPEPFSVDNDTMTPTFKLRRHQLLKLYQKQVDAMYAEINAQQSPST